MQKKDVRLCCRLSWFRIGSFGEVLCKKVSKLYTQLEAGYSSGPLIDYQLLKGSVPCRYAFNIHVNPDPHEYGLVNPHPNGS
jgi:hypothetical protein